MIIELVGLPGAGKTTFGKRLSIDGGAEVIRVGGAVEILRLNTLFLFCYPVTFFRQIRWLMKYRGSRSLWYTKFVNLFLVHNAKYIKATGFSRAIIDQGHHQNVISLFDTSVSREIIDAYVRLLPKPDILVFVVADDATRASRLAERGYGVRPELEEEEREAWGRSSAEHFEHLFVSREMLACVTETTSPSDEEVKLAKLAKARIWNFVMHIRMPTEKAHGLQIAKTLEALVLEGAYVLLTIPKRKNPLDHDIDTFYGLEVHISIRRLTTVPLLRLSRFFGGLAYWLDAATFLFALSLSRFDSEAVYYTRSPEIAWLFKKKGGKVVYEAHAFPLRGRSIRKRLLRHADIIIANSAGTGEAYRSLGYPQIQVVRNGVDIKRFMIETPKSEACTLLGLPGEKYIVMYVGAFYAWKGVPVLLDAWKKDFGHRGDCALVLIGGGEKELAKMGVAFHRLPKNVMLMGRVQTEKIPLHLRAADLFVLPNAPINEESIRYTSPIKLFEYMAGGRPIVASDLPSIREVLSEQTAFFAKAGDSESLGQMLQYVSRHEADAAEHAREARIAAGQYSWANRAKKLVRITSI